MKFIKYIALSLLCALTACEEDFLTNENQNVVSSDNFFQTEDDFRQATIGVFAPLRNLYGVGLADYGAWTMGEMRSDNTCFIYNDANRGFAALEYIDQFTDGPNSGGVNTKYDNDFIIIGRANQIITRIDNADISDEARSNYLGQALFMRSFAYFDLVQYFGAVPLKLEAPTAYDNTSSPRVAPDEIYNQIIGDIQSAIDMLPPVGEQEPGFITRGAARTLLGDIHLTRQNWAEAESVLMDISGYSLLSDYAAIFNPANKNNSEMILQTQYWEDQSAGLASNFAYNFLPALNDVGVIDGFPSGYSNGSGGFNTPTPDLIEAYDPDDLRFEASIRFYDGEEYDQPVPYIKKYVYGSALAPNTNNNWPIYRYAEVLLMIAEAKNEQGESDAIEYFNQVHAHPRTGLSEISSASQQQLRELIYHERQVELAFENKRWLDLKRTGRALEVMNAQGERIEANPQDYYYPEGINLPPGAYEITETDLLFPIPRREIQVNTEISPEDQNPGY